MQRCKDQQHVMESVIRALVDLLKHRTRSIQEKASLAITYALSSTGSVVSEPHISLALSQLILTLFDNYKPHTIYTGNGSMLRAIAIICAQKEEYRKQVNVRSPHRRLLK